ncbi:N-acetylglucosamine-6-phosphate deacetylase [Aliivibrio finisterrensis]|uniref:N-acetylglucosamine-6-phosphate deacetylase n=1 Tax=Aliivibrio finisterrensis TaxID=511998 RepID=UPI0010217C5C|nr:N-acetylglucosamine-6-phosphate deacetylase [Aliivibrio finisterrensis]RYU68180.1 N-acetylglucosamine-6-phosphate deacetylase [Aliivibrio finisterrensis]RYU71881.1 N-acetylglucosamine-6-phosphate deacetylase [Aliivibrio finisterrensis]RYU75490.1 N-acetylglucosamine-6-phosphate deacetylase [Aliivibrio finisterrensis]
MRHALYPQRVFVADGIKENHYVIVNDGKVEAITEYEPKDCEILLLKGKTLLPGFIDIHIHGRAGSDVMDGTPEALQTISDALLQTGVIAWVGTTVTAPWDSIVGAIEAVESWIQGSQECGAELLGSFLEGPYFTETHKGSHPSAYLKSPTQQELEELHLVGGSSLLRVAVAPEADGAMEAIKWLHDRQIKTSIAHTDATFEQVTQAYQLGADCGVHLFNGMRGLHHREPGCTGAVLYHDMLAELIADGIHVHPVMMQLAYRMKGYQNIALITDCMRAGGLDDGDYQLGAQTITVTNGEARTRCGSLAGSTCSLDQALRNMIQLSGVPEWEAVQMATSVPAKYLEIDQRLGSIAAGMDASFTVVNQDFEVQNTMMKGKWVY